MEVFFQLDPDFATDSFKYEEKIAVDQAVFWSTVRDKLSRIKNSFVKNIHSLPNLSYPICYYKCEMPMDPQNFQTLL